MPYQISDLAQATDTIASLASREMELGGLGLQAWRLSIGNLRKALLLGAVSLGFNATDPLTVGATTVTTLQTSGIAGFGQAPEANNALAARGATNDNTSNILLGRNAAGTTKFAVDSSGTITTLGSATISGNIILTGFYASSGITLGFIGGSTDTQFKNSANNAANLTISDAGAITVRNGLTVSAGGIAVSAGGLTVTSGTTSLQATVATQLAATSPATNGASRMTVSFGDVGGQGRITAYGGSPSSIGGLDFVLLSSDGSAGYNPAGRMVAGIFMWGTTISTSAGSGDLIVPFGRGLRSVNAGGTDTLSIVRVASNASSRLTVFIGELNPVSIGNAADINDAQPGWLLISNNTPPSVNPSGGGVLFANAGALKWRGSSGTITTIAVA